MTQLGACALLMLYIGVSSIVAQPLRPPAEIRTQDITYLQDNGTSFLGYIAYRVDYNPSKPAVLILPDRSGLDDYEKRRARMLAELGYVAMGVDVFGANLSQTEISTQMGVLRANRAVLLDRVRTALATIRSYPFVDSNKTAAIGYCFGGGAVLDAARGGLDLSGVVSFHGTLTPPPATYPRGPVKAKVLVLTGYDDTGIQNSLADFMVEMKNNTVDFEVDIYSDTVHAFTVFDNKNGYNNQSDHRSWARMQMFFNEIFYGITDIYVS